MDAHLIGKVGCVFTSTGTQHGGQETTNTNQHQFSPRSFTTE
jgi:multimeric flavodoxin WrbA